MKKTILIIMTILSFNLIFASIDFEAGYNDFNMSNININNNGIQFNGDSTIKFNYENIIRTYYARLFFDSMPMNANILKGAELLTGHNEKEQRTELKTIKGTFNAKFGESDSIILNKLNKGLNEIFVSSSNKELFYNQKYYNLTQPNYLEENSFIIGNSHFKGYVQEMCLSDGYFETVNRSESDCFEFALNYVSDNLILHGTAEYKNMNFKLIDGSYIEFAAPNYDTSKELNIIVDVEGLKNNNLFSYSSKIDFLVSENKLIIGDDKIYFDSERFLIKIKNDDTIEIYYGTQIKTKNNLDLEYKNYKNKIILYGNNNIWNQFIIVNENLTEKETFAMLNNYDIRDVLNFTTKKNVELTTVKENLNIQETNNDNNDIEIKQTTPITKKTNIVKSESNQFEEEEKQETSIPYLKLTLFFLFFGGVMLMFLKPEWVRKIMDGFK